jgi:hypothetical protein
LEYASSPDELNAALLKTNASVAGVFENRKPLTNGKTVEF